MGEGYIRFSYANSLEKIEDAMERIKNYCLNKKVRAIFIHYFKIEFY